MSYYTLFVFQHRTIAGTGGRRLVKASGSDFYFCIEYIVYIVRFSFTLNMQARRTCTRTRAATSSRTARTRSWTTPPSRRRAFPHQMILHVIYSNIVSYSSVFFLVVHDLDCSDQIMDDAAFLQARVPRQITLQHDTT